jgi:mucin-19
MFQTLLRHTLYSSKRRRPIFCSRAAAALLAAALCCLAASPSPAGAAQICAAPGSSGPASISGIVNSYYPGRASAGSGSTSIPVGTLDARGASTAVAAGDLLVIMQVQDAAINDSNSASYGGSAPGQGYTFLNSAGAYEYVTAAGPVSAGSIPITSGLINSYTASSASSFQGQRTFQVVRVPQYSSATLAGTVTAPSWNGATGGVVAIDVAGALAWNSQVIDLNGRGFRGGAAQQSGSNGTGDTLSSTDYVSRIGSGTLGLAAIGTVPNAAKGEGIAGTPIIVFVPTAPNNDNVSGTIINTGGTDGSSGGYPGGSFSRGAPGNAGGGGTDGNPVSNDQNSGGGGGGNYGSGGTGGFGWTPGTPPGSQTGGFGGGSVPDSPSRLFFGGGGGAGTTNNGTSSGFGILSSGAAGGGVALIRAGSATGSGTINANGGNGNISAVPSTNTVGGGIANDASGGGGAGGSVLVFINNGGGSTGATINVNGGKGGNNAPGAGVNPHGPGGGGSGGYAVLSGSATVNFAGGANGVTNTSAYTTADYGSTTSPGGTTLVNLGPASIPGVSPSPTCYPRITVSKTAAAANVNQGGIVSYTITAVNQSGYGTASGVTLADTLPNSPNFSYAATTSVVLGGGATRTATSNPTAGATAPSWGSFSIPGGGSVTVTFTVNVALATPLAVYQNPASVSYNDPTATSAGQTVTPGGLYAGGGTVLGSNYDPASSTAEDVTVRSPATFAKSFNPTSIAVNGTTVLTVVVSNPSPINLTGAGFTDSYPAGLVNAATPAASTTCAGGTVTAAAGGTSFILSGATIPAAGSCQVQVTVSAPVSGPFTNNIASGALSDNENITSVTAASATLQARPTIVKAFSPLAVPQNTNSTLIFTLSNANAAALTGVAFTDSYPAGLVNATPLTAGGTCTGVTLSGTTLAGAGVFNVTGASVPASGSCTITVLVQSATAGNYPNTTSGVTSTQTPVAGLPSNSAALGVGLIAINKAFGTSPINSGGTSTVTLTLTNPTGIAQTGGAFTDSLANMSVSANQTVGGTCTGVTPSTLTAGQTLLNFTGINIPAAGCTVSFIVTSNQTGSNPNTTSGVSTALLPAGPISNTAQLVVIQKPTIAKSFSPANFQPGGTSSLTLTVSNPNTIPLTGISFTDSYPSGLVNAAPLTIGGTCSGVTVGATTLAGAGVFNVTAGSVPALSSCTITVPVTSGSAGTYNNSTSGVASTQTGSAGAASNVATLNVVVPPAVAAKSFTPSTISQNGVSTVSFTLQNSNAIALTNVNFSDALSNMTVANSTIGGSCSGVTSSPALAAGASALSLTVPTLAAGSSCTITVQVTSSASGANPNQTSGATATESPVAGSPSPVATLNVLRPPALAKSFLPGQINVGGTTTLTFNVSNPNSAALSNVKFTDTLANMTVASTSFSKTCSGALSFSPALSTGGTQVNPVLTTLAANESCTVSVTVTSSTISPVAGLPNTTSGATSTETPIAGAAASASLDVLGPATITKTFSAPTIQAGGTSTITFTLSNPNASALTGASFSDTFPTGMLTTAVAQTYAGTGRGSCTGTIPNTSVTVSAASVSFASINIPAAGSCTVMVDVTAAAAGTYINNVTGVTSTQVPAAGPGASATLTVLAAPTVTKSFSPSTILAGGSSTLTLTITNPNATGLSGLAITDNYTTTGLVNLNTTVTNSCNGTATATPNTTNPGKLTLTGGTLAANSSCTVTATVTAATAGAYTNTTGGVTSTQTPTAGPTAADTLTVVAVGANQLLFTKAFSQPQVQAGPSAASLNMVFTISNLSTTTAATDVRFNAADTMPTAGGQQMVLANGATNSCSITAASPAGSCGYNSVTTLGTVVTNSQGLTTSLNFGTAGTGLRLAANSVCTVTCPVTIPAATTGGTYTNTAALLITGTAGFTNTAGDTASVIALKPPSITKAFAPAVIGAGSVSTITFTLANSSNAIALSNASFSDTLTNMAVAGDQSAGGTCGGAAGNSFSAGQTGLLNFSGLTLPAGGSCTVTLDVTSSTVGSNANTTSGVTTTQTPTAGTGAASVTLTVRGTTLTKAFAPASVRTGQSSTLTFTITNGTGNPAQSGLAFTETFPAGVVVASPSNSSTTCGGGTISGGPGSAAVALSGGALALNQGSCLVQVDVVSAAAGTYNNLAANVTGTSTGMTNSVNATLTVYNNAVVTKAFSPATIGTGGKSTLTFTIANGTGAPLQSGLGFTDTFPAGLTVYSPNGLTTSAGCSGQTVTATSGTGVVSVSGLQLAAAPSTCTVAVDVTSASAGSYLNSNAGNITALAGGLTANTLSSTLNVVGTTLSKAFSPATQQVGSASQLTLTITNGAGNPAQSGLTFTDTLPAGLVIASPNGLVNGCGGTVTATAGSSAVTLPALTPGSLAAATASCTVKVNTTAAAAGTYTNSAANFSSVSSNLDASSASATVNYLAAAGISKAFSPSVIAPGGTSTISFTLSNANSITLTGASFSDTLTGMTVSGAQAAGGSCGGASGNSFSAGQTGLLGFSGLSIPPGGCSVSLVVTATAPGTWNNTASGVTSAQTAIGTASNTAQLTVTSLPPTVTKSFGLGTIPAGGATTLVLTLANPAANPTPLTALRLDDNFPAGLVLQNASFSFTPAACGSVTKTSGAASAAGDANLRFSVASLAAGASCQASANVTSATAGSITNTTDAPTASGPTAVSGAAASAPLSIAAQPLITILKSANFASANPGQVVSYTVQIANTGAGAGTSVVLTDDLSPYGYFSLGGGTPFTFTDSSPASGLSLGTPQYSSNNGTSWVYALTSGAGGAPAGYDGTVTNWRIPMTGSLRAGGSYTLYYQVMVK